MAFTVKTEEGVKAVEAYLSTNAYLSGGNAPGAQDRDLLAEIEAAKFVPTYQTSPNLFGWWWTLAPFRENARALWGAEQKGEKKAAAEKKPAEKKEEKKAEEELDLFGEDDPEEAKRAEELKAKKKAEAEAKKTKAKPAIIAKSEVVFDVKGYEADDDLEALATKIRTEISRDGLVWKDTHRIVPIGFGINKLEMTMIIEDEKISTDDIFEVIESFDVVQGCDIVKFNKA